MEIFKQQIQEELHQHIMPFWLTMKDEENGGFYGQVDYELNINKLADKGGVVLSRYLWSFSAAYRVTQKNEYVECAHHAYDFLVQKLYDHEFGGVYWLLDYQGNPKDTTKHIYNQSFAIYALSEYYRATGKMEALELAIKLFRFVEEAYCAERNAYWEEFTREWMKKPNEKLGSGSGAPITTNTHLHILEAYTTLYKVWPDQLLRDQLQNLVNIFYEKIYNKETKFLYALFDKNWNSISDKKSYGHDIEASWLLDEALKTLGQDQRELVQMVIDIAHNIAEQAILEDGSLANDNKNGQTDFARVWWVQAEAIVGFLNAYERTGDERFAKWAKNLWSYIQRCIIDPRDGGEWYWSVDPDGSPAKLDISNPWKCPYHNSRFCLEVIERLTQKRVMVRK